MTETHSIWAFSSNIFYLAVAGFSRLPFSSILSDSGSVKSAQTSEVNQF